jgi:hypothetical protein
MSNLAVVDPQKLAACRLCLASGDRRFEDARAVLAERRGPFMGLIE